MNHEGASVKIRMRRRNDSCFEYLLKTLVPSDAPLHRFNQSWDLILIFRTASRQQVPDTFERTWVVWGSLQMDVIFWIMLTTATSEELIQPEKIREGLDRRRTRTLLDQFITLYHLDFAGGKINFYQWWFSLHFFSSKTYLVARHNVRIF